MILYFSATGNCKHVATTIARALDEKALSILDAPKEFTLEKGERFGIVTPTYFWELPIPVRDYLSELELELSGDNYTFLIATVGTTPGAVPGKRDDGFLRRKESFLMLHSVSACRITGPCGLI